MWGPYELGWSQTPVDSMICIKDKNQQYSHYNEHDWLFIISAVKWLHRSTISSSFTTHCTHLRLQLQLVREYKDNFSHFSSKIIWPVHIYTLLRMANLFFVVVSRCQLKFEDIFSVYQIYAWTAYHLDISDASRLKIDQNWRNRYSAMPRVSGCSMYDWIV